MEEQDLEPRNRKPKPRDLDVMSIEALGEYIEDMEAEIARVREAISAKENWRDNADSFFKK
ncbi:MAG: DUF1192 domain-containing protein [Rhodospirillaceae bacterium]|jgi:uncharacterized small protein (DUF1192 family)|nr:DUF1192 domain-containing protein [Rhodospirillaceae bacterium]MBT5809673.1 DUF1192 domain-containing protein [Rhodospirillaceae bacterium]